MTSRRTLLAAPGFLLLANCGPAPPPPAVVQLVVEAGADQNPDGSGAPVAVSVRLYTLTSTARFGLADAYALMEREAAVLGDERAGSEEIVVRPGENRTVTLSPKPTARFLGVAVLFREIDRATWRAQAPIAASGLSKFVLTIRGNTARLVPA